MIFFNLQKYFFSKKLPAQPGFTLIELILVVALLALIGGMSVPFLQSFQTSSDLNTYADTIVRTLRRAQAQAQAGQNNNSWGVFFDTSSKSLTLFYGSSYASRDQSYDQQEVFPESFTLTTDFSNEVYFNIFSGQPSASGQVTLSNQNNQTKTILIGNSGLIQSQ